MHSSLGGESIPGAEEVYARHMFRQASSDLTPSFVAAESFLYAFVHIS